MTKEIASCKNIKNRINRQCVFSLLTKISIRWKANKYDNGVFIYAGVDEFNKTIIEFIEPINKCDIFYYNCGSKFNTEIISKYMSENEGTIIFANGDECFIYQWIGGEFQMKKNLNANLTKRHNKGGQSAKRFQRLAEESRAIYVTRVVDQLNTLTTKNNFIFGSTEIVGMIMSNKTRLLNVINEGFLNFNKQTIKNTRNWIQYIDGSYNKNSKYDKIYDDVLYKLNNDIDFLDFDYNNRSTMDYCLCNDESEETKTIPFPNVDSDYYVKFCGFEYIGIKFYAHENYEEDDEFFI